MAFTLTIYVGGLCMLVQKKSEEPKGLYILMPEAPHHTPHCPVMITDRAEAFLGTLMLFSLPADEHLVDLAAHAVTPAKMPPETLAISNYVQLPVNPDCFTTKKLPCLARRVHLPLARSISPAGETAQLKVPTAGGGTQTLPFRGMVKVSYDVTDAAILEIAGQRVIPVSATGKPDSLTIYLANVPPSELAGGRFGAEDGDDAQHVQAYFNLLGADCSPPPHTPIIKHAEHHDFRKPGPKPNKCPVIPEAYTWPAAAFIDPANCTVGNGCDEYPC